jgi:hypothetical protein
MINYSIEGNVDFFKELQTIQHSIENTHDNTDNNCLLTGECLLPDAVTLQCGHKFNYKPLFNEVLLQKCTILPKNISASMVASYVQGPGQKHNETVSTQHYNSSLNLETTKLSYNEVKCPYCRTITPYLLPYYPYPDIKQIRYVNTPSNLCMPGVKCCYYASKSIEKECGNAPTYDETHGLLCKTHLRSVITATMNSDKVKKTKSKRVTNDISDTNMIIMSITEKPSDGCGYILTTGTRKGCQCGAKSYIHNHNHNHTATTENVIVSNNTSSNNDVILLCKRHYSMTHK